MAECYADVMLAAHSPPLFTARGAAQPELSVLYQNLLVITQKQQSPLSVRRYNTRAADSPTRDGGDGGGSGVARFAPASKPRRPCLVNRTDSSKSLGNEADSSSSSSSDENEPASPTRRKKKVVFADDRGLSLTHVRLMNEPSNQPPKLTLAALPGGGVASAQQAPAAEPPQWTVRFSQPASSYLDFRKRLDVGNVSLENVIVKSPDRRLLGTVKVRNLSYDKEVFVRCTRDRWTTHQDTPCTYVQNNAMVTAAGYGGCGGGGGNAAASPQPPQPQPTAAPVQNVTAIYDTFSFGLPLPADATSVEFAVCYKCDEFECWDNNDGNNYRLSAASAPSQQPLVSSAAAAAAAAQPATQPATSSSVPTQAPVLAESSHQPRHRHKHRPVHYFGAQSASRQNSWRLDDTSGCYW